MNNIPEGWKLVPVEPTPEMVEAAEGAYMTFGDMEMAIRMAVLAAPDHFAGVSNMVAAAVQGEPVAYWDGDTVEEGTAFQLKRDSIYKIPLYAHPQPAPDVSALVEALTELCDEIDKHEIHAAISKTSISWFKRKARKALADHRKGGES